VWSTSDGESWEQVGFGGFGDIYNVTTWWQKSVLAWEDTLWIGTGNSGSGGELWQYQPERTALIITDPNQEHTLTHTGADGCQVQVRLPAGALTGPATLVYTGARNPAPPLGFRAVCKPFSLDVIIDGKVKSGYSFPDGIPVEVTIDYAPAQAGILNEELLMLMRWNPSTPAWQEAACAPVERKVADNQLTVPICELGRFGLFVPVNELHLPTVNR
jgi:hypothetical protein